MTSDDPVVACEVASVVELTDGDVVAPNGRTGAEILSAIPESFQTTLNWDLSNSNVEVTVPGATGQSSTLNLTFTLPSSPKFYFEERIVAPESDDGVEVICDDYVKTTLTMSAQTQDGALSFEVSEVEVKLGLDDPSTGHWAKPFILAKRSLTSPTVEFISPVEQPADMDKELAVRFDAPGVSGDLTAYATSAGETYGIVVARW